MGTIASDSLVPAVGVGPARASPAAPTLWLTDQGLWADLATFAEGRVRSVRVARDDAPEEPMRWVAGSETVRGAPVLALLLVDMGPPWNLVGRVVGWPVVRTLASLGYVLLRPIGGRLTSPHSDRTDTTMTLALVMAVAIFSKVVRKLGLADQAVFEHPSVFVGLVAERSTALVPLVLSVVAFVIGRNVRWSVVYDADKLRWVVVPAALTLTVTAVIYQPNWFYGQDFLFDRAVVAALFVLIWWRPAATVPFGTMIWIVNAQFEHPIGDFTWSHKGVVLNIVFAFGLLVVVGSGRTARAIKVLLASWVVLFLGYYVAAGVTKVWLGWPIRENLVGIVAGTHAGGWLSSDVAEPLMRGLDRVHLVLLFGTLLIECGALALLAGRRVALWVLPVLALLHVVIFLMTGIDFISTWVIVLVALIIYLVRGGAFGRARPALYLWALVIVFVSPQLFTSYRLAWLDTPYAITYELEAVGGSGTVYRVDRRSMSPYDFEFTHQYMSYLSDVPLTGIHSFGTSQHRDATDDLWAADSVADIAAVDERYGESRYDDALARRFDEVVQARFQRPGTAWPIHPSYEIWVTQAVVVPGSPATEVYAGQEPIERVDVRLVKTWWDGDESRALASCVVREVSVDGSETVRPDTSGCDLTSSTG